MRNKIKSAFIVAVALTLSGCADTAKSGAAMPETDKELFALCAKAFERLEQEMESASAKGAGTAEPEPSVPETEKEPAVLCEEAFERLEQEMESASAKGAGNGKLWEGRRMDVNGDGLPDLVQEMEANGLGISPILRIFAYEEGAEEPVHVVFSDLNDMTEYYFVGADDKLIYDYSDHGEMNYGSYSQYRFDENWDRELMDRIEIYYFYDHYKEYEGEHEWYSEAYPDTYGARGSGYYYFHSRRRTMEELEDGGTDAEGSAVEAYWTREEINEQEFTRIYREMTGWDFFTVNTDFPRK
ncbi:MAG: hypothetical protein NC337_09785 [Roseburia sp.]|nr:hypothetical protein [Roseburia sp.]